MNDFLDGPNSTGYPNARIFIESVDQRKIMLPLLSKADAWIQNNMAFLDPSLFRQLHTDEEFALHIFEQIIVFRADIGVAQLFAHFHAGRVAAVVHQDHRDFILRRNACQARGQRASPTHHSKYARQL